MTAWVSDVILEGIDGIGVSRVSDVIVGGGSDVIVEGSDVIVAGLVTS